MIKIFVANLNRTDQLEKDINGFLESNPNCEYSNEYLLTDTHLIVVCDYNEKAEQ